MLFLYFHLFLILKYVGVNYTMSILCPSGMVYSNTLAYKKKRDEEIWQNLITTESGWESLVLISLLLCFDIFYNKNF